jgi:hypothetical protein
MKLPREADEASFYFLGHFRGFAGIGVSAAFLSALTAKAAYRRPWLNTVATEIVAACAKLRPAGLVKER